jgi:site-specific DNA-methyltransferase (adenine-specific)
MTGIGTSMRLDFAPGERLRLDQADAVEWLLSLPPESVDLVITDPAYESLEKHRNHGTTVRLTDWFPIFENDRLLNLLIALYRVLKPDAHCYVLCDQETGLLLHRLAAATLFTFHKFIVWDKVTIGMGYHYRARHEWIVFLEKGKRRLADLGVADVLTYPRVRGGYPTEKPVELLSVLVQQSSKPGDVVADCFAGSGSTGEAALAHGRRFWGCDVSDRALARCRERLAA